MLLRIFKFLVEGYPVNDTNFLIKFNYDRLILPMYTATGLKICRDIRLHRNCSILVSLIFEVRAFLISEMFI